MQIHYLQHVAHEGLGYIGDWAKQNGHTVTATKLYEGQSFPSLKNFDFLVVMGGSMSVLDETDYPWLKEEKKFVRCAIEAGKKVLGVCLGAQLIAHTLGAEIKKSPFTEIGWFPVDKTTEHPFFAELPDVFTAFHWHGEMFGIPEGAERIFKSNGCHNQGFLYKDRVACFQFHFEITPESVEKMLANEKTDMLQEKYIQSSKEIQSKVSCSKAINKYLDTILKKFTKAV